MDRLEGLAKLTGAERYIDDLPIEDGLWGMTVRSPVPRGRIRDVVFGDDVDWSTFVVVDHRDIPGQNEVFLIERDQPVLAAHEVRHRHEAVLLVAHPSRDMVRRAVRAVRLEIDELPPALDFTATPAPEQVQHGDDNVLKRLRIAKGDAKRAIAAAPHVVEGVYETGAQEHVYLENQGMAAWVEDGTVVVTGSMQCPYYVINALKHALGRDEQAVRVVHAPTGGGFGGKEDYPSIIAVHAALLALAAGRPVKMIYDRGEDMAATTKRHPARVRHRSGVDRDGRLLGRSIDVLLDGGAYVTLSPVVLSRAILHAAGPYACDDIEIDGRAVLTNAVPFGAFRGFGAPQVHFANERHMDVIARALDLDPVEVRRVNLLRDGQTTPTGQVIDDGVDRAAVLRLALDESKFERKRVEHARFNLRHGYLRRGVGLAVFHHGAGFTGSGEVQLGSRLAVEARRDGRVEILSANTEMGQGTLTIFTQIAAQRLGCDPADVVVGPADTALVPNSGPTVASRTAMVVGRLLERACDELLSRVGVMRDGDGAGSSRAVDAVDAGGRDAGSAGGNLGAASGCERGEELRDAIERWHAAHPGERLRCEARYEPPPGIRWDDATYRGDAYGTFAWAAYVAEVEVDLRTGGTRVTDFVAVQEVGKVLNEVLARGQIQGGVAQGIGWALMEQCVWERGAMVNNQLTNYIIPTSDDLPAIRVRFLEHAYPHGAQGAKGLGELPIDGAAPAVVNAMVQALGTDLRVIPATAERVMEAVAGGQCVA